MRRRRRRGRMVRLLDSVICEHETKGANWMVDTHCLRKRGLGDDRVDRAGWIGK